MPLWHESRRVDGRSRLGTHRRRSRTSPPGQAAAFPRAMLSPSSPHLRVVFRVPAPWSPPPAPDRLRRHEDPNPIWPARDGGCRRSDRRRPGDRPRPARDPHHLDREGHTEQGRHREASSRRVDHGARPADHPERHGPADRRTRRDPGRQGAHLERRQVHDVLQAGAGSPRAERLPADVADGIGHRDGHGRHGRRPRGSAHLQRGRAPEVRLRDAQQPRARQRGADRGVREAPGRAARGATGRRSASPEASRSSPASRCG